MILLIHILISPADEPAGPEWQISKLQGLPSKDKIHHHIIHIILRSSTSTLHILRNVVRRLDMELQTHVNVLAFQETVYQSRKVSSISPRTPTRMMLSS